MSKPILLNGVVTFLPDKNKIVAVGGDRLPLSLSVPASRCLMLLISHQGEVVRREYFFDKVWFSHGAQVTNNTFYQNISLLRRAFKEFGLNEEYIVTVPRVGIKLKNELQIERLDDEPCPPEAVSSVEALPELAPATKLTTRIWYPAVVLVILVLTMLLTWMNNIDNHFADYILLDESQGCRYYVHPDVPGHEIQQAFIKGFNLSCESSPYRYVSAYQKFARVSIIACRRPYSSWRENNCSTNYIIMDGRHARKE